MTELPTAPSVTPWQAVWNGAKEIWAAGRMDPFPLRSTLRAYSRADALADLRAALSVALMAIPQGMAYALIAGLPIKYGIFCSAIASIVGPMFASSRLTVLGPTNATAVLILSTLLTLPPHINRLGSISLLVLMVGILLVAAAFLRLANLTQYVSRAVVIGYIAAAGCLIVANQIHACLGYALPGASTFFDIVLNSLRHISETSLPAGLLAALTFLTYFGLRRWVPKLPTVAVALLLMSALAAGLRYADIHFVMLEPLPLGSWPLTPPEFRFEIVRQMLSSAFAIALFAMLENTFVAQSIASRKNYVLDVNQDVLSLGLSNMTCAFFCGMPASASPVRSSLNVHSGAATPMASIYAGILTSLAVVAAGSGIGFIPLPALAALVTVAGLGLIDWRNIRICWKTTRSDAVTLVTTFIAGLLFPLDFAILLGVAIAIVLFLRKAGTPQLVEYTFNDEGNLIEAAEHPARRLPGISIIHVEGDLFFGAASLFRDQIRRVCNDPNLKVIILRLKNARHLDATSVMALEELARFLQEEGRFLLVSGAMRDVFRVLRDSGIIESIGRDNFFMASPSNPNVSTRNALKRAQELIGREAEVRIFYDPAQAAQRSGA
jgi:SulP family sulfate permease